MDDYMKVSQAAKERGISARRVRVIYAEDKIHGVIRNGSLYLIPINTAKPIDGRRLRGAKDNNNLLFMTIDAKKEELNRRCPSTEVEIKRLSEQFMVDFTYNSNAIERNNYIKNITSQIMRLLILRVRLMRWSRNNNGGYYVNYYCK